MIRWKKFVELLSSPRLMADSKSQHYDVIILGGGLAGMTCALHCRKQIPEAKITIIEKAVHPVPEATHKVGESSVEVGAHYLGEFLGFRDHLENEQIPKMGLRLFFDRGDNAKIEERLEVGGTQFPPHQSYQFDRGRFENFLAEQCIDQNIDFVSSARINEIEVNKRKVDHRIRYEKEGEETELTSRWVVDASGRPGLLKRKLTLKKESDHKNNSAWIRIGKRVKVDDWSNDAEWGKNFSEDHPRWQSTNHMLGEGYWIWIIPLSSGSTSIGIVADPEKHPLSEFNSQEKFIAWIEKMQPQLGADIRKDEFQIQDFRAIKRYATECKELFSSDRWGIVGDAGFFIDPFYSPGNDFIAMANFFVCELIDRDLKGKSNLVRVPLYNKLFRLFYQGTGAIFKNNYHLFGHHQIMPVKIVWDWMVYWTITGHIVIQERLTDPKVYLRHMFHLKRLNDLNELMQGYLREWAKQSPPEQLGGTIDTSKMCFLMGANRALGDRLDDKQFADRFASNVRQMETLFWEIVDHSGLKIKAPFRRREHADATKGGFEMVFRIPSGEPYEMPMEDDMQDKASMAETPAMV